MGAEHQDAEDEKLSAQLARLPDLGPALREAPPEIKRQVFASFDLQIAHEAQHRVELTATVSEAVADAFEDAKALQAEGSSVVATDIAGARFVSRYDARIVERVRQRPEPGYRFSPTHYSESPAASRASRRS